MGQCETIVGLVLDKKSSDAIKRINDKKKYGNALAVMLSAGVFSSIFTKSNSLQASYNITQTDWVLYARAMKSVPAITKRAIEKEVELMIIDYQLKSNRKLLSFWKGIYEGCK